MPASTASRVQYVARHEDIHKLTAAAKAVGWTEDDSLLDYVEAADHCSAKIFADKEAAAAWLIERVIALDTVFGCGEIITIEQVPPRDRCRACICRGSRRIARVIVDDEGIADDEESIDDCI